MYTKERYEYFVNERCLNHYLCKTRSKPLMGHNWRIVYEATCFFNKYILEVLRAAKEKQGYCICCLDYIKMNFDRKGKITRATVHVDGLPECFYGCFAGLDYKRYVYFLTLLVVEGIKKEPEKAEQYIIEYLETLPHLKQHWVTEEEDGQTVGAPASIEHCNIKTVYLTPEGKCPDYSRDEDAITIAGADREISPKAFYHCDSLRYVRLPQSVRVLGKSAFEGCRKLKEVVLPEQIARIEPRAFAKCKSLEKVVIPNKDVVIDRYAFKACSCRLKIFIGTEGYYLKNGIWVPKNVVIPEGTTEITADLFADDVYIESVTLPSTVRVIGERAFSGCKNLRSINLPDGIVSIGNEAFKNCKSIRSINIPGSVVHIGTEAFMCCNQLNDVRLSTGIKTIGHRAFWGANKIKEMVFPSSIEEIGFGILGFDSDVEKITIMNPKMKMYLSFCGCSMLKEVILPPSLSFDDVMESFDMTMWALKRLFFPKYL